MTGGTGLIGEPAMIRFPRRKPPPEVLYSTATVPDEMIDGFYNNLLNEGLESIFKTIPRGGCPLMVQNLVTEGEQDASKMVNEKILAWNPCAVIMSDDKTRLTDHSGTRNYDKDRFWELVPELLKTRGEELAG
ncbi:MAG: hypothetical protein GY940_43945, partial [bacterium]|nr:hypothetical protein [bacterium]